MALTNKGYLGHRKVCVLGSSDDLYTKMVVTYLEEYRLPYDLVIVKSSERKTHVPRLPQKIVALVNLLYSGNFIALSKMSYYAYLLIWRLLRYKTSDHRQSLIAPFVGVDLTQLAKFVVDHVNHVALYKYLEREKYEIGLLAGVGIVHSEIIGMFSKFCLNAHPAPLPDCRGGGAVQFTLQKGLQPAASVHYVTEDIDAGSILLVSEIEVLKSDCINSLSDRITIHAAEKLVEVATLCLSGKTLVELPNLGKLNYWKSCTQGIQKSAEDALRTLKAGKSQSVRRWPN